MRKRWLRIGVLAGALFAINVAARLVVRFGFRDDLGAQDRIALVALAATGVAMAAMAIVWGRVRSQGVVVADLAGAATAGGLLSILVGPLIAGANPFAEGTAGFFSQVWLYAGFAGGGALIGLLLLIMLGRDHKSKALRRFAESRLAKPRR